MPDQPAPTLDTQGVATLVIAGHGALNILGSPAIAALTGQLRQLATETALRVLVLRGATPRAFIGGADIGEMAGLTPETAARFITGLAGLCDAVADMPVPVIGAIQGWCLGGGLEVALACDLRLCDDSARFGMPEVRVGIPSVIHAALLPRLVGSARATEMLLCCEHFGATQAEAWGLVHQRCSAEDFDAAVAQRAAALAALPPAALRQQKRLLRHWQTVGVDQAVQDSIAEFAAAYTTGEPQAHMADFLARQAARRAARGAS